MKAILAAWPQHKLLWTNLVLTVSVPNIPRKVFVTHSQMDTDHYQTDTLFKLQGGAVAVVAFRAGTAKQGLFN